MSLARAGEHALSHLAALLRLRIPGKPLLFEEYGAKRNYGSLDQRDSTFKTVLEMTLKSAADADSAVGGSTFWLLAGSDKTRDYDGYTVYMRDASTVALIRSHAEAMCALQPEAADEDEPTVSLLARVDPKLYAEEGGVATNETALLGQEATAEALPG